MNVPPVYSYLDDDKPQSTIRGHICLLNKIFEGLRSLWVIPNEWA
jgi:hypothetical protein